MSGKRDNERVRERASEATPEEAAHALYGTPPQTAGLSDRVQVQGGEQPGISRPSDSLLGAFVAEVIGTFVLVFFGTGALIVLNRPIAGA